MYYRSANCVIIVFDVTRARTFEDVKFWVNEVQQKGSADVIISIVGNKIDRDNREISKETGESYANSIGALYSECSALNGDGVEQIFENLGKRKLSGGQQTKQAGLNLIEEKKSKSCC
ncbi:Rab1a [Hexamita inflata]|nr:Rab1a [Hexamita inflata]